MPPNSAAVAAAACHSFDHISEAAAYSPAAALAARSSRETRRVAPFGFRWTAPPLLLWLLLSWLLLLLLLSSSSQSENSDKSKTVQPPTSKVRYITGIDVSYGLGSMEDPRKKPEPDMEIAKAYRSIIMGPQRENLGRGACFLGQRWENWKLQPFTFQSSGSFHRNVDPRTASTFFDGLPHSPYHIMLWYTTTIICILTRMRASSKQEEQIDSSAPLFQYG